MTVLKAFKGFKTIFLTNILLILFRRYSWSPNSEKLNLDFKQNEIKSTSGLYFEDIANLRVYHSEWAFVTFVNLSYFTAEAENLERTVETIKKLCSSLKNELTLQVPSSYCDNTMPQLQILLDDIREYSVRWFVNHEMDTTNGNAVRRRRKRGFFGAISKRLFFSMSDDEAALYRSEINALKAENAEHYLLEKNQTTLFQGTLRVLNTTIQSQIIQRTALQKQLDELEILLSNATASDQLYGKLSELMQYTTFVIASFWEKQQYFYDAITTKSKNNQIIPPRMFMSELERVSELVAKQDLHLPLPLTTENLPKLYHITTTEGRIIDDNLVLRLSIPLVEKKNFILYKATSVPQRNATDDTFNFIVPRNEYIALDSLNSKFLTITLDELKACHHLDRKNLVCKQTFPIMMANNNLGCEINLLRNTNLTSTCDIRTDTFNEELWTKLQSPNTYLYTMPKSQAVVINCPHSRTQLHLQGSGLITVRQRCRIKTERVEIVAFQTIESKIDRNFVKSAKFNVSAEAEIDNAKRVKSLSNPKLPHIGDNESKKITQISNDLDGIQMQKEINKASVFFSANADNEQHISPFLLVIIAVVAITIALLLTFVCFKYCAVQGCNLIIFFIVVAFAAPGLLYMFF